MTNEQSAAYVFAQAAAMLVELEAMKARNAAAVANGYTYPVYNEDDFRALIEQYGVHHNAVLTTFQGAQG